MNRPKDSIETQNSLLTTDQLLFIERENLCPLCNGEVKIRIRSYLENFTIAEEAECEKCNLVIRTKDHRMN